MVPGILGAMAPDGTQRRQGAPNLAECGDRAPGGRLLTS